MGGGTIWKPEQETLFGGGEAQEERFTDSYVDSLYKKLSEHYQ